jgi:hypothetical protein
LATKPSQEGFSVWTSKSSLRAQRNIDKIQVQLETLRRETRDVFTGLASEGSKVAVDACPLDEDTYIFPILLLSGVYHTFKL